VNSETRNIVNILKNSTVVYSHFLPSGIISFRSYVQLNKTTNPLFGHGHSNLKNVKILFFDQIKFDELQRTRHVSENPCFYSFNPSSIHLMTPSFGFHISFER